MRIKRFDALRFMEARIRAVVEERDHGRWPLTRGILRIASVPYGALAKMRARCYETGILTQHRLPCKVIAIGNLTTGGTGKTPMTIYIGRFLQKQGRRVVVISRGYKGGAEKCGGVVSDAGRILMTPAQAGDEPFMMAHQLPGIPVLVGQDRYRSGQLAVKQFEPDVILLDDGYQHLQLHRDINLLLLDARRPFGNGHLLPRGQLREPITAAQRADIAVFTRSEGIDGATALPESFPGRVPIFHSKHRPFVYRLKNTTSEAEKASLHRLDPIAPGTAAGQSVFAFSGIADNAVFKNTLASQGLKLAGFQSFPDHYRYSDRDLKEMISLSNGADWIATTEKDFYRMHCWSMVPVPMLVVGIEISMTDAVGFEGEVFARLQ